MHARHLSRSVVTVLTGLWLMLSVSFAAAQEAAQTTTTPAAEIQGVGTLFLLIGLAAVGLVSLVWLARERSANGDSTDAT